MHIRVQTEGNHIIALAESDGVIIGDVASAMDLMAEIKHHYEADRLILYKENICADFFDLSTRLAGEILQKYTNYELMLAIVGDFSQASASLQDFIRESNGGRQVFFVSNETEALKKLSRT